MLSSTGCMDFFIPDWDWTETFPELGIAKGGPVRQSNHRAIKKPAIPEVCSSQKIPFPSHLAQEEIVFHQDRPAVLETILGGGVQVGALQHGHRPLQEGIGLLRLGGKTCRETGKSSWKYGNIPFGNGCEAPESGGAGARLAAIRIPRFWKLKCPLARGIRAPSSSQSFPLSNRKEKRSRGNRQKQNKS